MTQKKAVIYHNPRCGKSRKTLQLLQDHGYEVEVIDYLRTPPTKRELRQLLKLLKVDDPREIMRKKEKEFAENGLEDPDLTLDALINTLIQHPILLERPIVVVDGKAVIGRPPENVLSIIT